MTHEDRDEAFAKYVRQTGMASDAQVEAARRTRSAGEALADALVRLGALTAGQKEAVEKKLDGQGVSVIGGCRLLRKLGEGGMGAVYLAEQAVDGRKVALKILPKKFAGDPEFLKRFRREADAAAALDHVNIARGLAAGEEKGYHYYLMEFCEGESLGKRLKRVGALPLREASDAALQVARGLAYAHALGFIHRDIKPDNLVLGSSGLVKILDLGLTKNIEDPQSTFRTATGAALGTPHYIAPEQARGEKDVDGRADLYSLGATYYHLLTGRTPFSGSSVVEVIHKHLHEQLPDPRDIRPDIPEGAVLVLRRLLAKRPGDRYPDAAALVTDLERVLGDAAPLAPALDPALSTVAGLSTSLPRRPRRGVWVAAGAAALLALPALVWWLSPPPALPPAPVATIRKPDPPPPKRDPVPEPVPATTIIPDPVVPPAPRTNVPDSFVPPAPEPPKPDPAPAPKVAPPVEAPKPPPPEPAKPSPRPEPAPAALRDAEKAFREPFKAEYALAAPSDRSALSKKLLALDPPADAAQDYVRLRDARDLAAQGGDAPGVLLAVDRLAEAFVVDVLAQQTEGLSQLAGLRTLEAAAAAAEICRTTAEEAVAVNRYDLSAKLFAKADAAARETKDTEKIAAIAARAKEAVAFSRELATLQGYVDTLRARPDDPASNTAMGRFTCFLKNDWERGLPMLVKGSDAPLKALAQKELSGPKDAAVQADLCEGWLAQADKERTNATRRENLKAHAREWFVLAADRLTEADRARLSKRLGTAPAPAAARPPAGPPTLRLPNGRTGLNLLALPDPARDAVNGAWTREGAALASAVGGDNINTGSVRIWVPYQPADEYELFLEVERTAGQEDLTLGLISPTGKPVGIGIDGWGAQTGSGMYINGQWQRLVQRRAFQNGRRHSIGIHVRRDRLRVMLDSQELMSTADYGPLSLPAHAQAPGRSGGFILGAVRSRFVIHLMVLNPLGASPGRVLPR